jgi:hypothetical protein
LCRLSTSSILGSGIASAWIAFPTENSEKEIKFNGNSRWW